MRIYRVKIIVVLLVSLGISYVLDSQVFLLHTPLFRKDMVNRIVAIPTLVKSVYPMILTATRRQTNPNNNSNVPAPTQAPGGAPKTAPFYPTTPQSGSGQNPTNTPYPTPTGTGWVTVAPTQVPTAAPTSPAQQQNPVPTYTYSSPTPQPAIPKVEFAQCLTDHGMKYYYTKTCVVCQEQKSLFGTEAYAKLNKFDCDVNPALCRSKGFGLGPAWETAAGKIFRGAMDLTSLHFAADCPPSQ